MKLPIVRHAFRNLALALAACLAFAFLSHAQGTDPNFVVGKEQQQQQDQAMKQKQLETPPPPKADPVEDAAYKAFYDTDSKQVDTKIQLGEAFVQKYPMSKYNESVYAGLVQAYYQKQDWKNFYANGDKALALNPDDVAVLATIGWVIPHVYDPNDPDAAKNLDKAERYEKHAIELSATMPKPASMTDDQFAQSKTLLMAEAHSGLGLVYFRLQQADDSVKQLQLATQGNANPDPTDLFVLGVTLQSLDRFKEATDAFTQCGQIPSALQDRCKQSADAVRKQAASSK
jgi:tetratricopeptide (TPR) repeat protein